MSVVGDHDPILLSGRGLGYWIECECGWISGGASTEDRAVAKHTRHVESTVPPSMRHPMRCLRCNHVHDAALVTVVHRYSDCSTWRCPSCDALIDDRSPAWGGSAERVTRAERT